MNGKRTSFRAMSFYQSPILNSETQNTEKSLEWIAPFLQQRNGMGKEGGGENYIVCRLKEI
jgi:hypothetical protein